MTASFHCAATTDDSTPLTLTWHRVSDNLRLKNMTGRMTVVISGDGQMLTLTVAPNATNEWYNKWRGDYKCLATNHYSEDSAVATLQVDDPPTSPPVVESSTEGPDGKIVFCSLMSALLC